MELLPAERRHHILETLKRRGKVLASELSRGLGVSEDTIRRDLRDLAQAGLLQRVHGGALPRSPGRASFAVRQREQTAQKAALADAAAAIPRDGQVLLMDGGTTTLEVARRLPSSLAVTVVTNSPLIAVALADHAGIAVVVVGGQFDKDALVTKGAAALETLRGIRADVCMLGVCSLDADLGITTADLEEAYVKRAMIAASADVIAVVTADKIGTASPYVVAPIAELTHIITDTSATEAALAAYARRGIAVERVPAGD